MIFFFIMSDIFLPKKKKNHLHILKKKKKNHLHKLISCIWIIQAIIHLSMWLQHICLCFVNLFPLFSFGYICSFYCFGIISKFRARLERVFLVILTILNSQNDRKWLISKMMNSAVHFYSKWFETVQSIFILFIFIPNDLKQCSPFPFYLFSFQIYCKQTPILSILSIWNGQNHL